MRKIFVISIVLVAGVCFASPQRGAKPEKNYGDAVVSKVVTVKDGFTFYCDIKGWPPVIGKDIPVKIKSLIPTIIKNDPEKTNQPQKDPKKFIEAALAKAKVVKLKKIKRGPTFSLLADVYVDEKSLGSLLIENGLARKYIHARKGLPVTAATKPVKGKGKDAAVVEAPYVASKKSKVFHLPGCRFAKTISPENMVSFENKKVALETGRRSCRKCQP